MTRSVFVQLYSTSHNERVEIGLLVLIRYTVELLPLFIGFWDEVTCKYNYISIKYFMTICLNLIKKIGPLDKMWSQTENTKMQRCRANISP